MGPPFPAPLTLTVVLLVLVAVVYLIIRRVDVRLVLLGAGLLMATLAGNPLAVCDTFTRAMVAAMVAPICAAMGFAAVLGATGCDRHLVHLLLAPVRRAGWAVVPGGIVAAYLVNLAVPSQTSTAAALGPILVPLLLASGFTPRVAGAALVLGASFGGDLLNPGSQDVLNVALATGLPARGLSARIVPAGVVGLLVAAVVFALLNRPRPAPAPDERAPAGAPPDAPAEEPPPRLNLFKALIPLVPVSLLLLAYALEAPLGDRSPLAWLLDPADIPARARAAERQEWDRLQDALPVVRAMLIGTLLAAAVSWRQPERVTRALFDGMGAAYGNIIALTITALCFGRGLDELGFSAALLGVLGDSPWALPALSVGFPWGLAVLSGSGSSPVQAFAASLLAPLAGHPEALRFGTLAILAAAFGRTMSPVAAVVIYGSGLVRESPVALVRCLLPALLAGAAVALTIALVWG
jgi:C4-dicarboxylate transporter, DcuC family